MSDGATHTRATLLLATGLASTSVLGRPEISLTLAAGALVGTIVQSDLDVDAGCYSFYIVRTVLGRPIGWLWEKYWWPYRRLVPHRSWFSHWPVLSTVGRLAYLAPGLYFLWPFLSAQTWGLLAAGLALADTLHFILDQVSTWSKTRTWRK